MPVGTGLLLPMEQREWEEGQGERTAAGRCQGSSVHERGEQGRNSPILALLSKDECLLDWQLHFLFILSDVQDALHIKTRREIPEMSFSSMLQIFLEHTGTLYEHVSREEMKAKSELTSPLEKTHAPDNSF